jgi:hypothetical protein
MPTAKEYRQQAEECLKLAEEAEELYVKTALIELAADFNAMAEKLKDSKGANLEEVEAPNRPAPRKSQT